MAKRSLSNAQAYLRFVAILLVNLFQSGSHRLELLQLFPGEPLLNLCDFIVRHQLYPQFYRIVAPTYFVFVRLARPEVRGRNGVNELFVQVQVARDLVNLRLVQVLN